MPHRSNGDEMPHGLAAVARCRHKAACAYATSMGRVRSDNMLSIAFFSIFLAGFALAAISWVFGELFEFGGDAADAVGELAVDGIEFAPPVDPGPGLDLAAAVDQTPSPASSRVIFSGLTAFGGFGFIGSAAGWPLGFTMLFAIFGFFLASAGMFLGVVVPISRQQGSTRVLRSAYAGMEVQVGIEIPAQGVGQVTFEDPNSGALVTEAASSADGRKIPTGAQVRIVRVTGSGVVVESVG
jgi:hypothetical protein